MEGAFSGRRKHEGCQVQRVRLLTQALAGESECAGAVSNHICGIGAICARKWSLRLRCSMGCRCGSPRAATTMADAAKLGDYLRYSMNDKYFKQITSAC